MSGMGYFNEAGAIFVIVLAALAVAGLIWYLRRERL
jgi:hypothetical protein